LEESKCQEGDREADSLHFLADPSSRLREGPSSLRVRAAGSKEAESEVKAGARGDELKPQKETEAGRP
jgi:hypothetical protein